MIEILNNMWVSVEDGLPEEGQQVIVTLQYETSDPDTIAAAYFGGKFFNLENKSWEFLNVSHWMYLPPPFNENS